MVFLRIREKRISSSTLPIFLSVFLESVRSSFFYLIKPPLYLTFCLFPKSAFSQNWSEVSASFAQPQSGNKFIIFLNFLCIIEQFFEKLENQMNTFKPSRTVQPLTLLLSGNTSSPQSQQYCIFLDFRSRFYNTALLWWKL